MTENVQTLPEGFRSITPHLVVRGADKAIEFYKAAFGAEEILRMAGPAPGTLIHAEIKINGSIVMLADECPDMGAKSPLSLGASPVTLHFYVEDVDAAVAQAVAAGAEVKMPVADMFWGDRYGQVEDPFGHSWSIATHKEDVTPEEMEKRSAAWFAEFAQNAQSAQGG